MISRTFTKPPADLVKALKATPPAWTNWQALSFSHQREHVEAIEEAKKPETRARRIAAAVATLRTFLLVFSAPLCLCGPSVGI